LAGFLLHETKNFAVHENGIALLSSNNDFAARSEGLRQATLKIAASFNKNLRHELYPVIHNWGDEPLAQIDRVAIPWFGLRAWGIHVNGFVRKADGMYLWIGERSADRPAEPGKLDNMIGGGQSIGLSIEDNLCKEAKEEAGIDAALALTAQKVRTIDYCLDRPEGMRDDTLIIYDLELPKNYTPRNTDGEVAAFHLMSLPQVADVVRDTDKFKFNCNLVIIDFLMRHKFITKEDKEYETLTKWLAV